MDWPILQQVLREVVPWAVAAWSVAYCGVLISSDDGARVMKPPALPRRRKEITPA